MSTYQNQFDNTLINNNTAGQIIKNSVTAVKIADEEFEPGDFTPFYIAIAICTIIAGVIFIFNIVCCLCSEHRDYWNDRNTGNRWIQSLWVVTPHKNPPLDLSELDPAVIKSQLAQAQYSTVQIPGEDYPDSTYHTGQSQEYMELHKRESEI